MKETLEEIYRALADNTECIGIGYEEKMLSIISYVKELEHFKDTIVSKAEISDEEIEKWIDSIPYYGHGTTEYKVGLEDGIKWYREQLKNK